MNAPKILLASVLAFAAGATAVSAAEPTTEHPAAKPKAMVSDPHTTAGLYVIWDEVEKAKLEKQGFPQYSN
jgi:copper(I)-binding protein